MQWNKHAKTLSEKELKIEEKKKEIQIKTIRFPKELIEEINKATNNKITFSQFVIDACIYALDNLDKK